MRTRTRGSPSWPERMLRGRIHYCRLIETNSQKSTCGSGAGHTFGTHKYAAHKKKEFAAGAPRKDQHPVQVLFGIETGNHFAQDYFVPYARSPASPRPGTMNARSSSVSSIAAVQIGTSG